MNIAEASRQPRSIAVLGSTGSIGKSTLSVLSKNNDDYSVFALTANRNAKTLFEQCVEWQPQYAVLVDDTEAGWLSAQLAASAVPTEVLAGPAALELIASHEEVDMVMAAIVGGAGLASTLAAVKSGKVLLLANKEALVMGGSTLMNALKESGAQLLPIDSEHNAIFQCLPAERLLARDTLSEMGIKRLLLTGSGGPFRTMLASEMHRVTPEQACAHPNWSMGRKISVDSATMMNKGLELIEACWLFNCRSDDVDILVHPQSVVHSMVEYMDGSVLAQMGLPDMRTPIAHALAWPARIESGVSSIAWDQMAELTFEAPDMQRFPALSLARTAIEEGGSHSIVLNAANEIAVEQFLSGSLAFTDIAAVVESCMEKLPLQEPDSVEAIIAIDSEARQLATGFCSDRQQRSMRV